MTLNQTIQKIAVRTSFHSATNISSLSSALRKLATVCLFASFLGCQTTSLPLEEHTLARAAMDAAKAVESARYSPGHWHQAEEAYRKAQLYIKEHDNEKARVEFVKARISAEKAENSARLIRQKNGEVL